MKTRMHALRAISRESETEKRSTAEKTVGKDGKNGGVQWGGCGVRRWSMGDTGYERCRTEGIRHYNILSGNISQFRTDVSYFLCRVGSNADSVMAVEGGSRTSAPAVWIGRS